MISFTTLKKSVRFLLLQFNKLWIISYKKNNISQDMKNHLLARPQALTPSPRLQQLLSDFRVLHKIN